MVDDVLKRREEAAKQQRDLDQEMTNAERRQVEAVLSNETLRAILFDPFMQQVIQDCSDPIKLRKHMANETTAQKISLLVDAGLLQFK